MKKKQDPHGALMSDDELVLLVKGGDPSAFTALSDRYLPALQSRAGRYANVAGIDMEDFLQEGLFALFRAAKGFDPETGARFSTYAITCINNSMTDAIKAHMKNLRRSSHLCIEDLDHRTLSEAMAANPQAHSVEDTYLDQEHSTLRTLQIENLLSDFEQRVLKLYLRGLTYQQISVILSTATKAVDNALQRVRRKLRPED